MPGQSCFLCASDEGVFLNVTPQNRDTFHKQLEACSLLKVNSVENLLNRSICHKCVFELKQCNTFVTKVKKCHRAAQQASKSKCFLCHESPSKGYIFDLNKDKGSVDTPLEKVKQIFNEDFDTWKYTSSLICLTCRYTLDILFDLKNVCENTVNQSKYELNEKIDDITFPKTRTTAVSRKTTIPEPEDTEIYVISDSGSECSTMERERTQRPKVNNNKTAKRKSRTCEGCYTSVKDGIDMYRYHRTGLTVCKNCWITMDPSITNMKRKKQQNSTTTKLCTVFLKDVLTHSAFKKDNVYKVEEDDHGNKIYIVTDESSEGEGKSQIEYPMKKKAASDTETVLRERKILTRNVKAKSTERVYGPHVIKPTAQETEVLPRETRRTDAKIKVSDKSDDLSTLKLRSNKRSSRDTDNSASSKSNSSKRLKLDTESKESTLYTKNLIVTRSSHKQTNNSNNNLSEIAKNQKKRKRVASSLSDADVNDRKARKKLKNILKGIAISKTDVSDESSSTDDNNRKKRMKLSKTVTADKEKADEEHTEQVEMPTPVAAPEPSPEEPLSTEKSEPTTSETPPEKKSKTSNIKDGESTNGKVSFVCTECGVNYKNKLIGMTHQLTHFQQLEIRLKRVSVDSSISQSSVLSDERVKEQGEDMSDGIFITVEDDEDDTEVAESLDSSEKNNTSKDTDAAECPPESELAKKKDDVQSVPAEKDKDTAAAEESADKENSHETAISLSGEPDTQSESVVSESLRKDESVIDLSKETVDKDNDINKETENERKQTENHVIKDLTDDVVDTLESSQPEEQDNQEEKHGKKEDEQNNTCEAESQKKDHHAGGTAEYDEGLEEEEEDIEIRVDEKDAEVAIADSEGGQVSGKDVEESHCEKDGATTSKKGGDAVDEKEVECENEIKIVDSGSSESSVEQDAVDSLSKEIVCEDVNEVSAVVNDSSEAKDDCIKVKVTQNKTHSETITVEDTESERGEAAEKKKSAAELETPESGHSDIEEVEIRKPALQSEDKEKCTSDSGDAAAEILQEVFDLATAELQKREVTAENTGETNNETEAETLENISREIQNSIDTPPFDCASTFETDNSCIPSP